MSWLGRLRSGSEPTANGAGDPVTAPTAPVPAAQAPATPPPPVAERPGGTVAPEVNRELLAKRDHLMERFTVMQADLGGLFYEMAIRDHVRIDVLTRRAAELQQVDAELGQVERLLRTERSGATGTCPTCGALHARGAVFCWQCGRPLVAVEPIEPGP